MRCVSHFVTPQNMICNGVVAVLIYQLFQAIICLKNRISTKPPELPSSVVAYSETSFLTHGSFISVM